ncbi:MAG: glycosyltransferase family 39 protein [bacterium]|nr:glycosyltransferase family 39 protein [bacterium]
MLQTLVALLERKHRQILLILIAATLVSGCIYSMYLGNKLRYDDERDYYRLATHIVTKQMYSLDGKNPSVFRPPGYPFIMAPFLRLGANVFILRLLNYLALAACLYLVYKILSTLVGQTAAALGVILTACYPLFFYTAGTLYPQIMASLLMLWIIYLLATARKSTFPFLLSGFLFGLLILTVPTFAFLLIVFAVYFLLKREYDHLWKFGVSTIICCIMVGTWSLRNYLVFGQWVPISANSGLMLLLGNSENTTPNAGPNTDICKYREEVKAVGMGEIERNQYYTRQAKEWISSHKFQALKLYILKVVNNFNFRNNLYTKREASFWTDLIALLTYWPLLLLFFIRLALFKKWRLTSWERLFVAVYFVSALAHAIYFPRVRYRMPFDFLMITVVATFIGQFLINRRAQTGQNPT